MGLTSLPYTFIKLTLLLTYFGGLCIVYIFTRTLNLSGQVCTAANPGSGNDFLTFRDVVP